MSALSRYRTRSCSSGAVIEFLFRTINLYLSKRQRYLLAVVLDKYSYIPSPFAALQFHAGVAATGEAVSTSNELVICGTVTLDGVF